MSTDRVSGQVRQAALDDVHARNLRWWWSAITILLLGAIFLQAILAGMMLSGMEWAREAHRVTAGVLIASALGAALVCLVSLRGISHGPKLGLTLLALAAAIVVQTGAGALTARGANLLWLHIPLGIGLFGLAWHAVDRAGKLPERGAAK